jgi:hypothetical protein
MNRWHKQAMEGKNYHLCGRMGQLELVENGGTIVCDDHFLVRGLDLHKQK